MAGSQQGSIKNNSLMMETQSKHSSSVVASTSNQSDSLTTQLVTNDNNPVQDTTTPITNQSLSTTTENNQCCDQNDTNKHNIKYVIADGGDGDTQKSHNIKSQVTSSTKNLGPFGGFSLIVGVIIGSGIFISVMQSLRIFIPSLGALLFLWLFCGLISLIGGLCYVQLGIMLPTSGGERTYLSVAFGRPFGVIFTVGYCFMVKTLGLAGIAQTFGKYFVQMIWGDYANSQILGNIISAIAIFILCIINSFSKDLANRTQILFTVLKLLAISGIIVIGIVFIALGKGFNNPNPFKNPFKVDDLQLDQLGKGLINIFWAYEGWNSLGAIVGEMKNPKKDLPISTVFGTLTVALVYCLTILSYVAVLGYDVVENTETVAALFASTTLPKASWVIPLFICVSTFGACNGTILAISRIIMTAAINRDIPGFFGLVRINQRTPLIAIFVPGLISMIFLLLPFQTLLNYCAFITWMFYGLTMAASIKLRWKHPDLDHSFRLPMIFPLIIILLSGYIVIMCFVDNLKECIIIASILLIIFGVQFLPERILRPIPLKNAHSFIKRYISKWYDLEMADTHDIS